MPRLDKLRGSEATSLRDGRISSRRIRFESWCGLAHQLIESLTRSKLIVRPVVGCAFVHLEVTPTSWTSASLTILSLWRESRVRFSFAYAHDGFNNFYKTHVEHFVGTRRERNCSGLRFRSCGAILNQNSTRVFPQPHHHLFNPALLLRDWLAAVNCNHLYTFGSQRNFLSQTWRLTPGLYQIKGFNHAGWPRTFLYWVLQMPLFFCSFWALAITSVSPL